MPIHRFVRVPPGTSESPIHIIATKTPIPVMETKGDCMQSMHLLFKVLNLHFSLRIHHVTIWVGINFYNNDINCQLHELIKNNFIYSKISFLSIFPFQISLIFVHITNLTNKFWDSA